MSDDQEEKVKKVAKIIIFAIKASLNKDDIFDNLEKRKINREFTTTIWEALEECHKETLIRYHLNIRCLRLLALVFEEIQNQLYTEDGARPISETIRESSKEYARKFFRVLDVREVFVSLLENIFNEIINHSSCAILPSNQSPSCSASHPCPSYPYPDLRNCHLHPVTSWFGLSDKTKIPSVGLATWKSDPGFVGHAVAAAIKMGYRHIDCAQVYGNEEEIGLVLKKLFEDGVVKREDLWITSKLWCNDHEPADIPVALNRTLNDLQLDYLDLYLMHWPVKMKKGSVGFKPENLAPTDIPNTWKAMEKLHDSRKARSIGVSNFSTKKLADLLDLARIPPAVNQVECHPSWKQTKLREFCKLRGVHITGYLPLGSPRVLKHPVLVSVAEKLGKTPAQVALRWGLQMGHSVLPKSTSESRMKENFDVFDWSIPEDMFFKISFEIEQARLLRGTGFVDETHGHYKTLGDLWDGEI